MLGRVIENWLTSVGERGFETPFTQLLVAEGHKIVHGPTHHPYEHGKDIVAFDPQGKLCGFQLKGGDIDLQKLEAIQGQLFALVGTAISYPGVEPPRKPERVVLVTNGILTPPARNRLEAFNQANRDKDWPIIEVVEKEQLIGRFLQANEQYLPSEPADFRRFLSIYLSDGRGPFPVDELSRFLYGVILPKRASALEFSRAIASASLFTAYASGPWLSEDNHVAVAEAWLSLILAVLWTAGESEQSPESWEITFELAIAQVQDAFYQLLQEAADAEDLVMPDLVEGLVYPIRALIVSGYLAAFHLSMIQRAAPDWNGDKVRSILKRELPFIKIPGEAGGPYVLVIATALETLDEENEASKLVTRYLAGLVAANQPGSQDALPPPYWGFEKLLLSMIDDSITATEAFDGHAYTLNPGIEWLARRGHRPILERLWSGITRILVHEFVPSTAHRLLAVEDEGGNLTMQYPEAPQSWHSLVERSSTVSRNQLPNELWQKPEILPFLGLLLPHHYTSAVGRGLDHITNKRCKVVEE